MPNFIIRLNELTGEIFYLPTEAQWEYAARGGNHSKGYVYSGSNTVTDVAWSYSNSNWKPHPVKTKAPNELGIYDMSGSAWEWCYDRYGYYPSTAQVDPTGSTTGTWRVRRGGGWHSDPTYCSVSHRNATSPTDLDLDNGFRLAR